MPRPAARQRPLSTATSGWRSRTTVKSSRTRRLLPIPAVPYTSAIREVPVPIASSRRPVSRLSSRSRPTNRIPDVPLQRPAPGGDDLRHRLDVGAQQRTQPLGVQPLAGRGRGADAGQQDGGELPLLTELDALRGGRRRRGVRAGRRRLLRVQRRVLVQDLPLELLERRAGVDAELLHEGPPRVLEDVERVGLAAAAVEREHELAAQPLAERVLGDEGLQLADELAVAAPREVGVQPVLQHGDPQLREPEQLALGERLVAEVGKRVAAPQRQCLAQPRRPLLGLVGPPRRHHQRLEAGQVQLAGIDPQPIAGRVGPDPLRAEQLAQRGDVAVQRRRGAGRRRLPPERLDEPVGADHLVPVQEQHRQQGALLRPPRGEVAVAVEDLERTEDRELHCTPILACVSAALGGRHRRVSPSPDPLASEEGAAMTDQVRLYDATYRRFQLGARQRVRLDTYGHDLGQNGWLTVDEWRAALGWLGLAPGSRVLDVACGSGGPARWLARTTGAEVVGVDSNRHAVQTAGELARQEGLDALARFQEADAGRPLPFDDASFDAVVCIDAINHLPDRPSMLRDWHRLLAPGGWALFTDPIV